MGCSDRIPAMAAGEGQLNADDVFSCSMCKWSRSHGCTGRICPDMERELDADGGIKQSFDGRKRYE